MKLFIPGGPVIIKAGFKESLPIAGLLGMAGGSSISSGNTRKMNDGERTIAAIQSAEGKRLTYKASPNHA